MRPQTLSILVGLVGGLVSVPALTWAQAQAPILEVEGTLEPGDAQVSDGSFYDEYSFQGEAGQAIIIRLESTVFDTYLWLLDAEGNSLVQNDDAGGTTNSQIAIVLPATGTYQVRANAYDASGQGNYRLVIIPTTTDNPVVRQSEADRLNDQGFQESNWANYPEALELFRQALTIRQDIGDQRGASVTLNYIGTIYEALGKYRQALNYYQRSLAITQDIGDRHGEGVVLNNIGTIYSRLGDYSEALNYYQRALSIRQGLGDQRGESVMLNNIGTIYSRLGDYGEALDYYQRSLAIRQDIGDRREVGYSLNNIGVIYDRLGEYGEALDYYQRSLAISQDIGDRLGEGYSLNNIGGIYDSLGDYGEALDYYQRSLAIRQDIGDRRGVGESLNNIGFIYDRLGDYGEALDYYQRSLAIRQDIGDRRGVGESLNNIGGIYDSLGDYGEALDYYQRSLAIRQDIGDQAGSALTLANIARWFESQGQPTLAILYFKQAINTYEAIRIGTQTLDPELQQSYTATIEDDYRTLADLLLQQDRVLEAQRVIDLLKVQELDDVLRGVRGEDTTVSGIPLTPEEQALIAESRRIFQDAVAIAQQISDLRQIPVAERTADQNARIFDLENQQSALVDTFLAFVGSEEVRALITRLEASGSQGDLALELASEEFINLRNNLAALGSDETGQAALLYPLILENRIELVLVTSSGPPTHYPIPVDEATLRDTVFEFREALRDRTSTPEPLAQQLYDWLIPPDLAAVLEQQDIGTLLYAPDGILRYVPLAALYDGDQWLVQRYRINHITAASLTDLNLQDAQEPQVLAGAFSQGSHPSPAGNFSGLPYAGIEVENLTQLLPSSPALLDEQFSLAGTAPLINDHTIVHFATHAAFLVDNPLESFILFGNGDRLTLQMLKGWRGRFSNVDLVVLSACETGVGSVRDADGQEILGFGYAMQTAGAKAVIASLWPVSDGGTQVLMTRFYEYLSQGLSKTEALQQAQISLITGDGITLTEVERFINERQSAEEVYRRLAHPYYWAPFILIGNGL
jgi:CHAT domain-containing protein/Tfp pilus assembly protein PilF